MIQVMDIASVPAEEECEPCNTRNSNYETVRKECHAFRRQLERMFGPPPEGAELFTHFNRDGDNGYYEVAVRFDSDHREGIDYAFKLEREMPAHWDEQAIRELQEAGVHVKARIRT